MASFTDTGCRHRLLVRRAGDFIPQPASAAARCSCQFPRPRAHRGDAAQWKLSPQWARVTAAEPRTEGTLQQTCLASALWGDLLFDAIKEADLPLLQRQCLCLPTPIAVQISLKILSRTRVVDHSLPKMFRNVRNPHTQGGLFPGILSVCW